MGLFSRLRDTVKRKGRAYQETQNKFYLDALCSAYENVFAQVRPLVNELKTVIPYGVTEKGKSLPIRRTPEIAALMDPNDQMGWAEFADAMFAIWLTEDELNVHVWRDERGRVYGYTILPVGSRKSLDGNTYFEYMSNNTMLRLGEDEVMTLRYSRSPRDIDKGVSPASAIFAWTQIDDLIAQYQKAYFENGAVPAYITTIRASSREKYEKKRADMEAGTKGAKNRNKTIYIWRQFLDDGSESDEVEVKTIQGNNSTLALKEILEAVNDKINKAFGVSNFIMGDDTSATYNNAELSDRNFAKHQVYPALVGFWSQFQHELDRICEGIGYALSFDYEIPELTDRKKTQAEIASKNADTLSEMINAGATPSAAIKALGLGDEWIAVADGYYHRVLAKEISSGDSSMSEDLKTKMLAKITPKTHSHTSASTTADALEYTPVFGDDELDAKKMYEVLRRLVVNSIDELLGDDVVVGEADIDAAVEEIMSYATNVANDGARQGATIIQGLVAGTSAGDEIFQTLENDGFHISDEFKVRWHDRTERLVQKYNTDARATMREALDAGNAEGLSREDIRRKLQEVVPMERADMIARTEMAEAYREGRLETDDYIAKAYGLKIGKMWRTHFDERTCEVCEAMDGQIVELHAAFPEHIEKDDGTVLAFKQSEWNDYGGSPNAHPLCRCDFVEVMLDD